MHGWLMQVRSMLKLCPSVCRNRHICSFVSSMASPSLTQTKSHLLLFLLFPPAPLFSSIPPHQPQVTIFDEGCVKLTLKMGRVKLPMKKIENTTNRQVTFSKRRNGIIKKAYELSVLCDVDVALIMFSPSGRPTLFSANTSIQEILERYINLPDQERGKIHNQENIQKMLNKLKAEADQICQLPSPMNTGSQIEEIQREICVCKSQMEEMEKRLRLFEGDPSEITTLCEAEYREHVLQQTLKKVHLQKVHLATTVDVGGFVDRTSKNTENWLLQGDPHVQILNFDDAYDPAPPLGDQQSHSAVIDDMLAPISTLNLPSTNTGQDGQMNSRDSLEACNNSLGPEFGQVNSISQSSWEHLHHLGCGSLSAAEAREGLLIEQYLSQFT